MAVQRDEHGGGAAVLGPVSRERVVDTRALAFLAEASAVLGSSLDYEATLSRVAQLAVPELADWCVVDLLGEDGRIRRVAVVSADQARRDVAERLRDSYPARVEEPEGTAKVLRTGRAELIEEVSDDWVAAIAPNEEQLELLRGLELRSNLIVPLIARGRTIGALTLATAESGRTYGKPDLALAEELGARAAMAVDNARLFRDAEESLAVLDTLLARAPVGLAFWDLDLRYVRINDTLAALDGRPPGEHLGRTPAEVLPDIGEEVAASLRRVLEDGEPILNVEFTGETPAVPGARRHWLASYYPVRAPGGAVIGVGAVVSEITERRRAEQRLSAQHAVSQILAESPSLDDAAARILEALCESLQCDLGTLWLLEKGGEVIRCADVWHSPSLDAGRFARLSRRLALPRGVGLPGRVWSTHRPAWVSDIAQDPNFPRIEAAAEIGLRTAFACPIVLGDAVLGAIELFQRHMEPPDAHLLRAMVVVGGQIGHFLDHKEAEQERIRLLAREHVARAEAEAAQRRFRFLAEASALLASSLDYEVMLARVAELAVPYFADWCVVDLVVGEDLRRVAVAHEASAGAAWLDVFDSEDEAAGSELRPAAAVRTGEAQLVPAAGEEGRGNGEHVETLRRLGLRSYMCVPMKARGRRLGALSFATAESGRRYGEADLHLAEELARRAATSVDNTRLFRAAQERAQAANVLTHVGDGVFLLDGDSVIRLWNPAAEAITGLRHSDVVGLRAGEAIPQWESLADDVPVVGSPRSAVRPAMVHLELPDRELWLSMSGVGFDEGTVYAFRDLTEERALERMKTDFVSTISHELRTPLAAIFGSGLTLRRDDVTLSDDRRIALLDVIVDESNRLARIVDDVLLASRLDSGILRVAIDVCDPAELVRSLADSRKVHAPPDIEIVLAAHAPVRVAADAMRLRQVLGNLVDNAIKYSPNGGVVEIAVHEVGDRVQFRIRDEGIGIPPGERERIFEKFYRLDPELTRGVGGTGLGLYICRELVRRMDGQIWVEAGEPQGSTFVVDLPKA
jgi:PAS domain S-box-containing protein